MRRAIVVLAVLVSTAAFAQGLPDLAVTAIGESHITPELPAPLDVLYWNLSPTAAATSVRVTVTSLQPFLSVPSNCTIEGNRAVCSVGTVEPRKSAAEPPEIHRLAFTMRAPEESGARVEQIVEISSSEGDAVPRDNVFTSVRLTSFTHYVTTTSDSGPGSLREAIERMNATCRSGQPCVIGFRIPNGGAPWVTIATATPLPHVTGHNITFEGATQTVFAGDTNPHGPEVEVTGVAQRDGNGFVFLGCFAFEVAGLAINGFPGSGVLIAPRCGFYDDEAVVRNNYIGTDPTGTRAVRNQRGVYVDGVILAEIVDNVISGNMRSGVYLERGRARVHRNLIGFTPARTPLGNGASGVYIGPGTIGTEVTGNSIGYSAHWGIAIHRDTRRVLAAPNLLEGNFGLGIDWGFDMVPDNGVLGVPMIGEAISIEFGNTLIRGFVDAPDDTTAGEVHLYESDAPHPSGYGEGQRLLDTVPVTGRTFTLLYPRPLHGKWITATFTHSTRVGGEIILTTSEFSRAVQVQ
jgi:hypothetical protein